MDAAVRNQPANGLPRNLAAVRVVGGQDDGAGRVVDDQVDARGELEGADVSALPPDDASLEIVAGQIDHRYRCFD
jgi:hypothetical protein